MSEPTIPEQAPRTRWGAIIWGVLFGATAAWALAIVLDPARLTATVNGLAQVSPFTVAMWGLILVGGLTLVGDLVAVVRRGQKALASRRAVSDDDTVRLTGKPQDTLTEDVVIPD